MITKKLETVEEINEFAKNLTDDQIALVEAIAELDDGKNITLDYLLNKTGWDGDKLRKEIRVFEEVGLLQKVSLDLN